MILAVLRGPSVMQRTRIRVSREKVKRLLLVQFSLVPLSYCMAHFSTHSALAEHYERPSEKRPPINPNPRMKQATSSHTTASCIKAPQEKNMIPSNTASTVARSDPFRDCERLEGWRHKSHLPLLILKTRNKKSIPKM